MKEIKEMLLANPEYIENILIKLNFYKVKNHHNEIICGNSEKGRGSSIHIKLDENITSSDFKYGVKGDFFSFLIKKRNLELKDVINIVKKELGIDSFTFTKGNTNSIFGGAYKKIKKPNSYNTDYAILDDIILDPYLNKYNIRFLEDGISLETQKNFKIGFDRETQRITIPWWSYEGDLIGIMGRYNGDEETVTRWLPIIPFSKKNTLYGYSNNYRYLQQCDDIYIGESEKFTLQLNSMNIKTAVSLGRNEISSGQIKKLIALQPKRIIYCLDEGLPEDISIKNVKATQQFLRFYNIKVGYVYDENNEILPQGKKLAPSDLGKDIFLKLINNKVKEVVI